MSAAEMLSVQAVAEFFEMKSRQWVYTMMRKDPTFPRPRQIGSVFTARWSRSELQEWADKQPRAELTGVSVVDRRKQVGVQL